jgi:hypothetical protein
MKKHDAIRVNFTLDVDAFAHFASTFCPEATVMATQKMSIARV